LAEAWPSNAAHSQQRAIAIGAVNQPPLIETAQDRSEKAGNRPAATLRIQYGESADIRWIVTHAAANNLHRLFEVGSSQFA
jgi:hypothetical protein